MSMSTNCYRGIPLQGYLVTGGSTILQLFNKSTLHPWECQPTKHAQVHTYTLLISKYHHDLQFKESHLPTYTATISRYSCYSSMGHHLHSIDANLHQLHLDLRHLVLHHLGLSRFESIGDRGLACPSDNRFCRISLCSSIHKYKWLVVRATIDLS